MAVGVVAVPAALLANGFSDELQLVREQQREERRKHMEVIGYCVRRWLKNFRARKVALSDAEIIVAEDKLDPSVPPKPSALLSKDGRPMGMLEAQALKRLQASEAISARKEKGEDTSNVEQPSEADKTNVVAVDEGITIPEEKKSVIALPPMVRIHLLFFPDKRGGRFAEFLKFFTASLIFLNLFAVLMESIPEYSDDPDLASYFSLFELFSVLFFTLEYALRLFSSKVNKNYSCSRLSYASSWLGLIDLFTVLPFWIDLFTVLPADHASLFRLVRIFRVLQLEQFVGAFGLLSEVFSKARASLVSTGFLALLVWVVGSVLFYEFEKENPRQDGAFKDLPSSMYYAGIFLGGEWGKIDFTPAGSVVLVWYASCGIAVFSLPVGSLFEAFGDVLEEASKDAEEEN